MRPPPLADAVVATPTPRISEVMVEYRGDSGTIPAYLARPTDGGPRPAVLVIHELFGLVDHTKDVASRIAREGYVALAPNLFASRDLAAVLTPDAVQKAMQFMFRLPRRDPALVEEELAKLPAEERAIAAPTVRIGSVGFCFGGGMSARVACEGGIRACVIFYGENPTPIDRVRGIAGAVLGLYGGDDVRINEHLDELVRAMVQFKKDFEMRIYPGAAHAFFNDTRGTTYREAAAKDAWDRVVRFYRRTLGA